MCSNTTNEILKYHYQFASLMAQRIDDASRFQYDLKDDDLEMTRLAKNIRMASSYLSTIVESQKYELQEFVSILRKEKVQVTVPMEVSLAKRIATIFATSSPHPDSGAFLEHIILSPQGQK